MQEYKPLSSRSIILKSLFNYLPKQPLMLHPFLAELVPELKKDATSKVASVNN
jgi:hypothetical protein